MSKLAWPLKQNRIRRGMVNHTFGLVRNNNTRNHQGWDLYAAAGTPIYAVTDGRIHRARNLGNAGFGNTILLEFQHEGRTLYATYAHLSCFTVRELEFVTRGQVIGKTGNTGNAVSMRGEDQHLHFEIRYKDLPGLGLGGRIDPAEIYGPPPLGRLPVPENHREPEKIQCLD